ncbi:hypothetical protein CO659_04010 [Rhizobium sp. S9]|nr:hypothetical protein CO659_04010 [Rhizobium sp. S9]
MPTTLRPPLVSNVTKKTQDLRWLIERIGQKADFLTAIRESLVSISRLVAYHSALENPERRPAKDVRQRIKLLQRDAASLGDHAAFLSGKINFVLDATLGLINLEQNQIIKIFSVAAVVFPPPTLVASIYGNLGMQRGKGLLAQQGDRNVPGPMALVAA